MGYQDEWLLLEAEDDIDEVEHRQPTEEFLFYQAVTNGDMSGRTVSKKGFWTATELVCYRGIRLRI